MLFRSLRLQQQRDARRGVRITLLLQAKYEYFMQYHASRAVYSVLLKAGIEIIEYEPSFLHAKVAVVDADGGALATVGSSNLDPLSLLLAREANVVIEDTGFAGELRENLLAAITGGAEQVKRESWKDQPLTTRVFIHGCYEFVRILTGMFAYGRAEEFT